MIFSDRRLGMGEHTVSEDGKLRPTMPEFSLLYRIIESAKSGKDIVIDCMRSLLDYNDFPKVYMWLKKVADIVYIRGVKLYISTEELSGDEIEKIRNIVDVELVEHGREVKPYRIYEDVLNYLERYSRRRRVCIIIEDIQWADRDSYLLLEYLARNIKGSILLILSYRNEDISVRNDYQIVKKIMECEKTRMIRLMPLDRDSCHKILENLRVENRNMIYEKSGGNPLFLIQLSNYPAGGFIPDTMRESIEHQIESLDDLTLFNLRFLSVLGYETDMSIVNSLLGEGWMGKMENHEWFIEAGRRRVRFKNRVIRDVIYSSMSPDIRLESHYRIGKYLLKRSIYEGAYHLYKSRRREAIRYLKMAAESSMENYAMDDAIDYYEKALEIAEKYSLDDEIFEILEKIGDIKMMTGRYGEAIVEYERILKRNRVGRVLRKIGSCHLSMGDFDDAEKILKEGLKIARGFEKEKINEQIGRLNLRRGKIDTAIEYFKKYLDASRRRGSDEEISLAYENLAVAKYYLGDYRGSLNYARKSMDYLRKSRKYERLIPIYNLLGAIYDTIGDKERALKNYKSLLNLASRMGDLRGMSLAYNNMGILYYSIGTMEDVRRYLERALELHRKMGDIRSIALSYYNLSGVYGDEGKFSKAIDYGKRALEIYEKIGDIHGVSSAKIWIGIYNIDMGEYEEAKRYLKEGLKIARREGYRKNINLTHIGFAKMYIRNGKLSLAKRYLDNIKNYMEKEEKDMDVLAHYYVNEIEYYLEKGDIEEAERKNDIFMRFAKRRGDRFLMVEGRRLKAFIECKKGNLKDAERYFEESIEEMKNLRVYHSMGEAYFLYGKYLLEKDENLGKEKLKIAKELFSSMNLKKRVMEINKILH